ncbi:unnamed protein product [Allacma fusca]|uniref:Uncharacterized protein n=1 Tax=Allacma fusca TaxID=39272 RepID=A0A8J2L531_9HEXA|nr:unnamed protein product [Allacma fusca]
MRVTLLCGFLLITLIVQVQSEDRNIHPRFLVPPMEQISGEDYVVRDEIPEEDLAVGVTTEGFSDYTATFSDVEEIHDGASYPIIVDYDQPITVGQGWFDKVNERNQL